MTQRAQQVLKKRNEKRRRETPEFADRDPLDQGVSRPGGPSACRMWRTFDYTTYFALYFDLYRIAKQRPDWLKESGAADYLERAYGTARAYFEVPANLRMEGGWSFTGWVYWQYTVGNFHEKYLLPLIAALEAEGQQAKADFLRAEWEKKVKYFIYDSAWPFASEMPIDSTAYESTYADHGLVAGIEAARTVLFDDPDFGLLAYGGEMAQTSDGLAVIPRDGVRQRFSALLDTHRLHLELDRDGFASGQPIVLRRALDGFSFQLESRAPQKHETTLTIEGLPPGSYSIGDGASRRSLHTEPGRPTRVQLTVPNGDAIVVRLEPPPGPTSETGR